MFARSVARLSTAQPMKELVDAARLHLHLAALQDLLQHLRDLLRTATVELMLGAIEGGPLLARRLAKLKSKRRSRREPTRTSRSPARRSWRHTAR